MLTLYSETFQAGKGAFYDDFMREIMGKYFYKPSAPIDSEEGLLGRFNWHFQGRLLVLLDENGEFVTKKKQHGRLRSWFVTQQMDYKQCNFQPVTMSDHSNLVALTNELLSLRVESRGDARNAVIAISEDYSKYACEEGRVVEGEPMTHERRNRYFRELYEAIHDPLVQGAFVHEMMAEECAGYDFQAQIPHTELRETMQEVSDDNAWVDQFLTAWREGGLSAPEGVGYSSAETVYEVNQLFTELMQWAERDAYGPDARRAVRNVWQVGIRFRSACMSGRLEKRKSHGRLLYQLTSA
jgi:hypothetical protein